MVLRPAVQGVVRRKIRALHICMEEVPHEPKEDAN